MHEANKISPSNCEHCDLRERCDLRAQPFLVRSGCDRKRLSRLFLGNDGGEFLSLHIGTPSFP